MCMHYAYFKVFNVYVCILYAYSEKTYFGSIQLKYKGFAGILNE